MSETAIFIVGVIVFAITIYGAVMAGGLALTRLEIEQNQNFREGVDEGERKKRFSLRMKY